MIASLRGKSGGGKRSGNGRECRLPVRQGQGGRSELITQTRRPGHGAQAQQWFSSLKFEKTTPNNKIIASTSTSPETDPGTSDLYPFFKDERRRDEEGQGENRQRHPAKSSSMGVSVSLSGLGLGLGLGSSARSADGAGNGFGSGPGAGRGVAQAAETDFLNPLFHTASADAEKAVASLFPGEKEDHLRRPPINGSNPMFNRTVSEDAAARARRKMGVDATARGSSNGSSNGSSSSATDKSERGSGSHKSKEPQEPQPKVARKKEKGPKAMYEHVGRMNVRPFMDDDDPCAAQHQYGFRVDTFARNEGETGGKAHFKFVFTADTNADPSADAGKDQQEKEEEAAAAKKARPVLDAIHERDTGNLRIRVNDGREISATGGASVEIALVDVGVVLFNPKTMGKGHHLYTLSLHGRTLFSVLA